MLERHVHVLYTDVLRSTYRFVPPETWFGLETERIDIKIGGYIERKLCLYFRSFKPHSCWQREVIVSQISHFMVENDREIGARLKYLLSFGSKWSCECLHM